jgi:hypothetical protein
MSQLIEDVLQRVIRGLVAEGKLELVEDADPAELASALVSEMKQAGGFQQASPFLGRALLQSPLVAELWATDRELAIALNHAGR